MGFLLPLTFFYADKLMRHNGETLGWAIVANRSDYKHEKEKSP